MKIQDPHNTPPSENHCKRSKSIEKKVEDCWKRESRDLRRPHTPLSHLRNKSFKFRSQFKQKGIYLKTFFLLNKRTELGVWQSIERKKKEEESLGVWFWSKRWSFWIDQRWCRVLLHLVLKRTMRGSTLTGKEGTTP